MTEHILIAPPEDAPGWVHDAWERIESGDSITGAAHALRKHPKSLRRWVIEGEAERQAATTAKWREDNPEETRALGRASDARRDPEETKRYHRAYRRRPERRGTCRTCGGPMGVNDGIPRDGTCSKCNAKECRRKDQMVVQLWRKGESMKEIATAIGITPESLGVRMVRMRKAGSDLPLRRKPRSP